MNKNKNAFSLIELLLVMALLATISLVSLKEQAVEVKKSVGGNYAEYASQLGQAVEKWAAANYGQLQAMTHPNCAIVATNVCELNLNVLLGNNFLPTNFDFNPVWGGSWRVRFRAIAPPTPTNEAIVCRGFKGSDVDSNSHTVIGCPFPYPGGQIPRWQYKVEGLLFTSVPVTEGGTAAEGATTLDTFSLGYMTRELGLKAGVSGGGTLGDGFYGNKQDWFVRANAFGPGVFVSAGQFAYYLKGGVLSWTKYIRVDGAGQMRGNLDMGGENNLLNVRDIFLNGPTTNIKNKNLSSIMPNLVLVGTFNVDDGTIVPKPECPNGGVPQIKVLMRGIPPNSTATGYCTNDGTPETASCPTGAATQTPTDAATTDFYEQAKAKMGWQIGGYDTVGGASTTWTVVIKRTYKNQAGVTDSGFGLAEVYCRYNIANLAVPETSTNLIFAPSP